MGETRQKFQTFTISGSWTAPAGVTAVQVMGVGAGGGGGQGGGGGNANGANTGGTGGGGGGGSPLGSFFVSVTPNSVYTVTLGTGGPGGSTSTGLSAGQSGTDGTDTTFVGTGVSLTFKGARGGSGGEPGTLASIPTAARVNGGTPTRPVVASADGYLIVYPDIAPLPGQGGYSWLVLSTGNWGNLGGQFQAGGSTSISVAGSGGGIVNNQTSGQGGGGGGASGWQGTTAANGGAGASGASTGGTGAASVAPNYGCGGGGGGGVGQAGTASNNGGAGGAGAPGALMVIWSE